MRDSAPAAELGVALAPELVDIHAAGIAHRDLKPQNMLLVQRIGKLSAVKLLEAEIAGMREFRDQVASEAPRIIDFGISTSTAVSVIELKSLNSALRMPGATPDPVMSWVPSGFFSLDKPPDGVRPGDRAVGALLAQLRVNPFTLFAIRESGPLEAWVPPPVVLVPGREILIRYTGGILSRQSLLRFLNVILAAFSLALILLLSALAHPPAALAFTLLLVAVYRCFGRRGEADDLLVPAHQSLSAVAGRRPERR